jgi:hypothetical protein
MPLISSAALSKSREFAIKTQVTEIQLADESCFQSCIVIRVDLSIGFLRLVDPGRLSISTKFVEPVLCRDRRADAVKH